MIDAREAMAIIINSSQKSPTENISISQSLGRILAAPVYAPHDSPPFSKSAMDGYAYKKEDPHTELKIIETIPAGTIPSQEIQPGECAKIMTGAMIPEGANWVVRREFVHESVDFIRIKKPDTHNICYQGENLKQGDLVLEKGMRITPAVVGILAFVGVSEIEVSIPPTVGVVTTGSEIVEPGDAIQPGQIYNSNGHQLVAQLQAMDVPALYLGRVHDEYERTRSFLEKALATCSVVIISGGVSAGDYDLVPDVLQDLGVELRFKQVAIKPGKPTVFGTKQDRFVFGLPGNPLSTFMIFEYYVKPFLYNLMGHAYQPLQLAATLADPITRKSGERLELLPIRYEAGKVYAIRYVGSGHLNVLSQANGFIEVPIGTTKVPQGEHVRVRPFWS
jgi:molybdopterin molybdotransferase